MNFKILFLYAFCIVTIISPEYVFSAHQAKEPFCCCMMTKQKKCCCIAAIVAGSLSIPLFAGGTVYHFGAAKVAATAAAAAKGAFYGCAAFCTGAGGVLCVCAGGGDDCKGCDGCGDCCSIASTIAAGASDVVSNVGGGVNNASQSAIDASTGLGARPEIRAILNPAAPGQIFMPVSPQLMMPAPVYVIGANSIFEPDSSHKRHSFSDQLPGASTVVYSYPYPQEERARGYRADLPPRGSAFVAPSRRVPQRKPLKRVSAGDQSDMPGREDLSSVVAQPSEIETGSLPGVSARRACRCNQVGSRPPQKYMQ